MGNPRALTEIVRHNPLPAALMITHRHPLPAAATQHQPLQEGRSLPWGVQSVGRIGLTIRGQLRDMRFIRLPGQIAHMGIADDHLPLLTGQGRDMGPSIRGFGGPGAAKDKRPCIAGVVEEP
jgi:hypothetical protein